MTQLYHTKNIYSNSLLIKVIHTSLYISQIKKKCGIEVGKNYNQAKSEDSRQPQCPEEKEKAIVDALEHFKMV